MHVLLMSIVSCVLTSVEDLSGPTPLPPFFGIDSVSFVFFSEERFTEEEDVDEGEGLDTLESPWIDGDDDDCGWVGVLPFSLRREGAFSCCAASSEEGISSVLTESVALPA